MLVSMKRRKISYTTTGENVKCYSHSAKFLLAISYKKTYTYCVTQWLHFWVFISQKWKFMLKWKSVIWVSIKTLFGTAKNLRTIQMSYNELMGLKKWNIHTLRDYNWGQKKKKLTTDMCNNVDGSQGHYALREKIKADHKNITYCMITLKNSWNDKIIIKMKNKYMMAKKQKLVKD